MRAGEQAASKEWAGAGQPRGGRARKGRACGSSERGSGQSRAPRRAPGLAPTRLLLCTSQGARQRLPRAGPRRPLDFWAKKVGGLPTGARMSCSRLEERGGAWFCARQPVGRLHGGACMGHLPLATVPPAVRSLFASDMQAAGLPRAAVGALKTAQPLLASSRPPAACYHYPRILNPAKKPNQRTMVVPDAAPSAAAAPSPSSQVAVVWECPVPASCAGLRLHEALQRLQPGHYPSVTAAKMAVSYTAGSQAALGPHALGHTTDRSGPTHPRASPSTASHACPCALNCRCGGAASW